MTLILGLITPEFVALTSDRRITWMDEHGNVTDQIDSDNKTFNFAGSYLVGFTGIARLWDPLTAEWITMDRWLIEKLAGVEPRDYIPTVRDAIQSEFDSAGYGAEPHAFLGVGFLGRNADDPVLRPVAWIISNSLNADGLFDPGSTTDKFRVVSSMYEPEQMAFLTVGLKPDDADAEAMKREVWDILQADPENVEDSVGGMVQLSQKTAQRSYGSVGSSMLITTLPRAICPAPWVSQSLAGNVSRAEWLTEPIAFYLSIDPTHAEGRKSYSPALISPDCMIMGAISELGNGF